MHASFHELLSLRDEVAVDAAVAAHVRECAQCRGELRRLRSVTVQLRSLPPRWTPPGRWDAIAAALHPVRTPVGQADAMRPYVPAARTRLPGWRWPLAAAAAVAGTVALIVWQGEQTSLPADARAEAALARQAGDAVAAAHGGAAASRGADSGSDAEHFMARSYVLEQALAALPQEPRLVRAGTALTLADLQDRIRWVDYHLAFGEEAGLQPQQTEQLWRERVDLLNSLVAVRYAQTRAPL